MVAITFQQRSKMETKEDFTSLDSWPASRMLRRKEAAWYMRAKWGIPLSQHTLAKLAVVGGGPLYRKVGRYAAYERRDLDDWAESKIGPKRRSSSDVVGG
jgi:hypothetical protein